MSEIEESGCVLVRPDGYVAWRSERLDGDAQLRLAEVIAGVLACRAHRRRR